jgi:hypothetical protein
MIIGYIIIFSIGLIIGYIIRRIHRSIQLKKFGISDSVRLQIINERLERQIDMLVNMDTSNAYYDAYNLNCEKLKIEKKLKKLHKKDL